MQGNSQFRDANREFWEKVVLAALFVCINYIADHAKEGKRIRRIFEKTGRKKW